MRHFVSVGLVSLALLFLMPATAFAGIITIKENGSLEWNVLAYQDEVGLVPKHPSSLAITKVHSSNPLTDPQVELKNADGKILLSVTNGTTVQNVDVSEVENTLVEIEQQNPVEKVEISRTENSFTIKQQGITAETTYPISISPKDKTLAVATESGLQYISVLPSEAVESVVRPRIITTVHNQKIGLTDRENDGLVYAISGEKIITPFNLFSYKIPIIAFVSASDGELMFLEQPNWFRVIGFLFT